MQDDAIGILTVGEGGQWDELDMGSGGDATTPSFVRGDVYIPITGSGDTREILDGMKRARKKGVDIFPITVSKSSGLVTYLKELQHEDNIIYIPVQETDREIFHDRTPSKINTIKMNQITFRK